MPIDETTVHKAIERKLSQWVASLPNPYDPIIGTAGGEDGLSPIDILNEVRDRTPQGLAFVERWHQMALEHIMNSELDNPDEQDNQEELRFEARSAAAENSE